MAESEEHEQPYKRRRLNDTWGNRIVASDTPQSPYSESVASSIFDFEAVDPEEEQRQSQNRFHHRMENIFLRYSADWSAHADEVNIRTGAVIVDKGHLAGLPDALFDEEDYEYESFTSDEDGLVEDHDEDILDLLQTPAQQAPDWLNDATRLESYRTSETCSPAPIHLSTARRVGIESSLKLPSEAQILQQFGPAAPAVLEVIKKQQKPNDEGKGNLTPTVAPVLHASDQTLSVVSTPAALEQDDLVFLDKNASEHLKIPSVLRNITSQQLTSANVTPLRPHYSPVGLLQSSAGTPLHKRSLQGSKHGIRHIIERGRTLHASVKPRNFSVLAKQPFQTSSHTRDTVSTGTIRASRNVSKKSTSTPTAICPSEQVNLSAYYDVTNRRASPSDQSSRRSASTGNYRCNNPGCGKLYTNKESLRQHRKRTLCTPAGPQEATCPAIGCGRPFTRPNNLIRHMLYHCDYLGSKEILLALQAKFRDAAEPRSILHDAIGLALRSESATEHVPTQINSQQNLLEPHGLYDTQASVSAGALVVRPSIQYNESHRYSADLEHHLSGEREYGGSVQTLQVAEHGAHPKARTIDAGASAKVSARGQRMSTSSDSSYTMELPEHSAEDSEGARCTRRGTGVLAVVPSYRIKTLDEYCSEDYQNGPCLQTPVVDFPRRQLSSSLFAGWFRVGKPKIRLRIVDSLMIHGPRPGHNYSLGRDRRQHMKRKKVQALVHSFSNATFAARNNAKFVQDSSTVANLDKLSGSNGFQARRIVRDQTGRFVLQADSSSSSSADEASDNDIGRNEFGTKFNFRMIDIDDMKFDKETLPPQDSLSTLEREEDGPSDACNGRGLPLPEKTSFQMHPSSMNSHSPSATTHTSVLVDQRSRQNSVLERVTGPTAAAVVPTYAHKADHGFQIPIGL